MMEGTFNFKQFQVGPLFLNHRNKDVLLLHVFSVLCRADWTSVSQLLWGILLEGQLLYRLSMKTRDLCKSFSFLMAGLQRLVAMLVLFC